MTHQPDTPAPENDAIHPKLWGWPTYVSIATTIVILVVLTATLDLKEIWKQIVGSDKRFLLVGALAHYSTYVARGFRWRRCLIHLQITAGKGKFVLLVFFYNFVDNVLPAKLGDVYAAHLARINCGVRRSAAIGSIVFLRMVDIWIVLMLAAAASWSLFSSHLPTSVMWSLVLGCVISVGATTIMLVFFLFKKSLPGWIPGKIQQMIQSFQTGMWPRAGELLPIAVTTVIVWALETIWIYCLVLAFGMQPGFDEVVFLTMIPLLASAFPFTPSGTGVVELTLFSCLRVVGAASPLAASVTVVNRFIDYWLHIFLGILTWAIRRAIGLRTWRDVPMANSDAAVINNR